MKESRIELGMTKKERYGFDDARRFKGLHPAALQPARFHLDVQDVLPGAFQSLSFPRVLGTPVGCIAKSVCASECRRELRVGGLLQKVGMGVQGRLLP